MKKHMRGKFQILRKTRRWLAVACLWIAAYPFHASAQYPGYSSISNITAFKETFATRSSEINSIVCDFDQEKTLAALSEKIRSSGNFKFRRADKIRIEYQTPYYYLLIMNGDKIFVKEDGRENQVNVRSNRVFRQIQQIILECVQGTILTSDDFEPNVFENSGYYLLEMTPVSKNLSKFYSSLVLIVDKKDYTLRSLEMNEPSGDKTLMIFKNKLVNTPVGDDAFRF
jgi:outer membrane lipoprotein-sorting protein